MQPTRSDLHVTRPLTNVAIASIQESAEFACNQVFPNLPVDKQADKYYVYPTSFWQKANLERRADATESVGIKYKVDPNNLYFCDVWSAHVDIGDQQRGTADAPINLDMSTTRLLTHSAMLRRELIWQTNFLAAGIWQGFFVSGSPVDYAPNVHGQGFWDTANADPVKDVDQIISAMRSRTGQTANCITMTDDVYMAVKTCPSVLDKIKYTQRGVVTKELLAMLFDVEKVVVTNAVLDTAAEGATPNPGYMSNNKFLITYAPKAPGIMVPSAGYNFSWKGLFGSGNEGVRIRQFRMEELSADRVEIDMALDSKVISAPCGVLGVSVLAP